MSYKILTIGDLHIGGLETFFPGRGLELQCTQLRKILKYALTNKCSDVVVLGDVFDVAHPSQETISFLLEVLLDPAYRALTIWLYPGNHDISRSTTVKTKAGLKTKVTHSLLLLKDMIAQELVDTRNCAEIVIHTKPGRDSEMPFYFLPYPHMTCDEPNVIVFAHNSVRGSKRDNGHVDDTSAPFDSKRAQELGQLWISGHLHTPQSQRRLHYPGVPGDNRTLPWRQHFLGLIEWDGRTALTDNIVQTIEWEPDWQLCRVDIREVDDQQEALDLLTNKNVRLKLVMHEGITKNDIDDKLTDNPAVIFEAAKPKKSSAFTKKGGDGSNSKGVGSATNKDWIIGNLPKDVKRSRSFRQVERWIDEAENL